MVLRFLSCHHLRLEKPLKMTVKMRRKRIINLMKTARKALSKRRKRAKRGRRSRKGRRERRRRRKAKKKRSPKKKKMKRMNQEVVARK